MNFVDLNLSHKNLIEKYITIDSNILCDYSFNDLFLWRNYFDTKIYEENDTLFICYRINGEYGFSLPLGNTDYGIKRLIEYTRKNNIPLRINAILEDSLSSIPNGFKIIHLRGNDDYIYDKDELKILSGKKFKVKRNLVNSFQSKYNYKVEVLNTKNDKIISFIKSHSAYNEYIPIIEALNYLNELDLKGLVLYVDDEIVALSLGSLYNDTFITHFEKCDYSYSGASQMINYLMANYIGDNAKYINREEDLGIMGIRQAKLSYNPIKLIKSYSAIYINDYNIEIKKPYNDNISYLIALWENVFNDGAFSKIYLTSYFDSNNTFVVEVNKRIVAMAIVMKYGDYHYLYALCTHPDYRGLGLASMLTKHIMNSYSKLFLVPASKDLIPFYLNLGFNLITSKYSYIYEFDSNDLESSKPHTYEDLLNIYSYQDFNKIPRTINDYYKIFDLYNCKSIANDDSYVLYRLDNDKLLIFEHIGKKGILNTLMKDLDIKSCNVVSNFGDNKIQILSTFDYDIFANMLFE